MKSYYVELQWARDVKAKSAEEALQKALALREREKAEPELYHVADDNEEAAFEVATDGTVEDVG